MLFRSKSESLLLPDDLVKAGHVEGILLGKALNCELTMEWELPLTQWTLNGSSFVS